MTDENDAAGKKMRPVAVIFFGACLCVTALLIAVSATQFVPASLAVETVSR